jgi:hypothetical protein
MVRVILWVLVILALVSSLVSVGLALGLGSKIEKSYQELTESITAVAESVTAMSGKVGRIETIAKSNTAQLRRLALAMDSMKQDIKRELKQELKQELTQKTSRRKVARRAVKKNRKAGKVAAYRAKIVKLGNNRYFIPLPVFRFNQPIIPESAVKLIKGLLNEKHGKLYWTGTADVETTVYDSLGIIPASRLDQYNSNLHFARERAKKAAELFGGTYEFKLVRKSEERGLYLTIVSCKDGKKKKEPKKSPASLRIPKETKKRVTSGIGIKLGAGYLAGDFSNLPVIKAGIEWQRKLSLEAGFGMSGKTEDIITPDGPGTLRKRLVFGRLAVFPTKNFPLGVVAGYDRDENRIEEFGRYAVRKEGPSIGLRMRYKMFSLEGMWTPGEVDYWYKNKVQWERNSFRLGITINKIFGGK